MDNQLPHVFHALADPTRMAVIDALAEGPVPVSTLADPHDMALPSFLKHIRVLEKAGLVSTAKTGRVREVRLEPKRLRQAFLWFRNRKVLWQGRLDRVADLVDRKDPPQ